MFLMRYSVGVKCGYAECEDQSLFPAGSRQSLQKIFNLVHFETFALTCTVSEILQNAGVSAPDPTPYSTLILGVFPVDKSRMLWSAWAETLKLFTKYSKPNLLKNIPGRHRRTDGQTDRRTDDLLWHNRILRSIAQWKWHYYYTSVLLGVFFSSFLFAVLVANINVLYKCSRYERHS